MIREARLQVFQQQLAGLAEEMGVVLVRAALSSNIKERMDSSTALFDLDGGVIAQAAHIPVHLGSMSLAARAVLAAGAIAGETWMLNDPYAGGTHLPDITLVEVIAGPDGASLALAAVRAHHADVGGELPGSMHAEIDSIEREGVRIPPTRLGGSAGLDEAALAAVVADMRQPNERRGDLLAQQAALAVARRRLPGMHRAWGGADGWQAMVDAVNEHGERRCRAALARAAGPGAIGSAQVLVELPGAASAVIRCQVTIDGDGDEAGITIDLTDSDAQTATSLNCPRAVTIAAALFVVRSIFDPDLPAAAGSERPIRVLTTPGTIVDARYPAAVAAGNVEISSLVVEVIRDALAEFMPVPAQGQGTMNNVIIGNDAFSWYETIAGGQGASAHGPGPSAVQVAMTNAKNTPIEAIENEFPIIVERYALRDGSGGAGQHVGGDGVVRALRVLEPCTISLLAQRRRTGPRGRAGGGDGQPGEQFVDGVAVPGLTVVEARAGTVIEVRTPGGGGWGKAGLPAHDPNE